MKLLVVTTRARKVGIAPVFTRASALIFSLTLALILCAGFAAWAQDAPDPSLGDVARKARKEHALPHAPSKQLVNEEEDGPDTTGVWRMHLCPHTPCYELTITLPKTPKWTRGASEPRPVLIALPGAEEDAKRMIRIYAAESLGEAYLPLDAATREFVQGRFARPEYFGRAAQIVRQQQVQIDYWGAIIAQFTITPGAEKFRGISVVAGSPNGNYGFACVFREEDAKEAESICDAVVKSARNQVLFPPPMAPVAPPDDPPGDDPPEDDPE